MERVQVSFFVSSTQLCSYCSKYNLESFFLFKKSVIASLVSFIAPMQEPIEQEIPQSKRKKKEKKDIQVKWIVETEIVAASVSCVTSILPATSGYLLSR
jgi:hypothetical protein